MFIVLLLAAKTRFPIQRVIVDTSRRPISLLSIVKFGKQEDRLVLAVDSSVLTADLMWAYSLDWVIQKVVSVLCGLCAIIYS